MSRRTYVIAGLGAAVIAVGLVAASLLSAGGDDASPPGRVFGEDTAALLAGIPQQGTTLGRPTAPVTLVEFADFQCPYCAEWSRQAFGEIVHEYVKTGKVRMEFRGLEFLGSDSDKAFRFALAAGEQGKFWNVAHLLYDNQGSENSGWVSDELLAGIGAAIPSFRLQQALDGMSSPSVDAEVQAAQALADTLGIDQTPSFAARRGDGDLKALKITSLDADGMRPALDSLLAK